MCQACQACLRHTCAILFSTPALALRPPGPHAVTLASSNRRRAQRHVRGAAARRSPWHSARLAHRVLQRVAQEHLALRTQLRQRQRREVPHDLPLRRLAPTPASFTAPRAAPQATQSQDCAQAAMALRAQPLQRCTCGLCCRRRRCLHSRTLQAWPATRCTTFRQDQAASWVPALLMAMSSQA